MTGVDYVNENTSIVHYEIDVMQTWFIQGGYIRPCMVLREHVNDDTFARNLEEEPIGSDAYDKTYIGDANTLKDINDNDITGAFNDYSIIVNTTGDVADAERVPNGTGITSSIVDGIFNGTCMLHSSMSGTGLRNLLDDLYWLLGSWDKNEQKIDVLDISTFPTAFSSGIGGRDFYKKSFAMPSTFDTYTPKNKKLLTYPYNFLLVTTRDGSCGQFKWELFNDVLNVNPTFKLYGSCMGGGNIICFPSSYNGVADDIDDKIVMDSFPKNAFSYDAFQAWIASGGKTRLETAERFNNARMFVEAVNIGTGTAVDVGYAAARGGLSYASYKKGDMLSAGIGAVDAGSRLANRAQQDLTGLIEIAEARNKIDYQWKDASYRPNIVVGTQSSVTSVGRGYLNFYFIQVHVREHEAKHIDDFFSCYGYAINRVKAPNLTGRQYWNFVQTKDAVIGGDMPASSKEAIGRIFDGGITFWHDGDQVGNYAQSVTSGSIDNPIVT